MMTTIKTSWGLLACPSRTVKSVDFDKGAFSAWVLCQLPMIFVLVWTGLADPAEGYGFNVRSGLLYLGGSLIICLFTMLLAVAKSFLILWFGGIRTTLLNATRKLLPLHCLLVVVEALITFVLFQLRGIMMPTVYAVVEQIYLFGLELLFGVGAVYILYQRERVSLRRSLMVGMGYFICASGWLLLTVLLL